MTAMQAIPTKDDPRHLRAMMDRASELACDHEVASVFVGIAGEEGDLLAPEFLEYVESALRMEDRIYRLLRERAVVLLADVDVEQARAIVERLRLEFVSRFGPSARFEVDLGFFAVARGQAVSAKEVLPQLFGPPPKKH